MLAPAEVDASQGRTARRRGGGGVAGSDDTVTRTMMRADCAGSY
jgi:hypothetical protein